MVLNLSNDAYVTLSGIEQSPYGEHIILAAHEGVGDEGHVVVDGKGDVLLVALGKGRQIHADTRYVHTLACAEHGVVLYAAEQGGLRLSFNHQAEVAIVNEHMSAYADVAHKVGVAHGDAVVRGILLRTAAHLHLFAALKGNRFGTLGGAHFGAFGVDEHGYVARHLAHVVNDALHAGSVLMSCIEAHHIHSGVVKALNQAHVATLVGDGGYNFCLLVHRGQFSVVLYIINV